MDDAIAKVIKNQLDAELAGVPRAAGIAFGHELFNAFAVRGWITFEKFVLRGTGVEQLVEVYAKTHSAHIGAEVGDLEFKVGW